MPFLSRSSSLWNTTLANTQMGTDSRQMLTDHRQNHRKHRTVGTKEERREKRDEGR